MANTTANPTSQTATSSVNNNINFDLTGKKVSKKEYKVLESSMLISDIPGTVKRAYAEALRDSHDGRVERTNVCGRMSHSIKNQLSGKIKGLTRFELSRHTLDVAFQCYQMDFNSDTPSCGEIVTYKGDGHKVIYLRARFLPSAYLTDRANGEGDVPVFTRCSSTSYRNGHTMGFGWKQFATNLSSQVFMMYKADTSIYYDMFKATAEYDNSKDDKPYSGKESLEMKLKRAKEALVYLEEYVMGKPIVFSAVPDSRSRVAKYRYYFVDGTQLDPQHTWFINFFSESWRSNMFESYDTIALTKKGLDALKVTAARFHWKSATSRRMSWKKARSYYSKHETLILAHCSKDRGHGLYYPRMATLIKLGVGTETGFLLEADLSASGIGSAAMNIHSKGIAEATALTGKATPADAHRSVVEHVLAIMLEGKSASLTDTLIAIDYKNLKKINVEITHAQTVKTTTARWNQKVSELLEGQDFVELTEDDLRAVYDLLMPGLLEWIETITSITMVGVSRDIPVLFFRAPDGVKCATSAYTKGREFSAHAVDKNAKSRRLALKMDMPIEVDAKGVCYEGVDEQGNTVKYWNKTMGAWANMIQADDAWMLRAISLRMKEEFGIVPLVKHDGYYIHPNYVNDMIAHTYEVRKEQFIKRPLLRSFEQIASFLEMHVEGDLADHGMTISDFNSACPSESPLMMT